MDVSNRVGHRANNVKFTPTFRLTFMGRVIQISSISGCLTVLLTLWSVAVSDPLLIPHFFVLVDGQKVYQGVED